LLVSTARADQRKAKERTRRVAREKKMISDFSRWISIF